MWNNDQQQGTWWPNYNYPYQAISQGKYPLIMILRYAAGGVQKEVLELYFVC